MHVPRNTNMYGVFEPPDVDEMRRELKRGDVAGELEASREFRAAAIIQRRMIPEIDYRVRKPKIQKKPAGRGRRADTRFEYDHARTMRGTVNSSNGGRSGRRPGPGGQF